MTWDKTLTSKFINHSLIDVGFYDNDYKIYCAVKKTNQQAFSDYFLALETTRFLNEGFVI